jgi:hypothetical protein
LEKKDKTAMYLMPRNNANDGFKANNPFFAENWSENFPELNRDKKYFLIVELKLSLGHLTTL